MARKKAQVVQANPEHDKLIETLKFTPRNYKIQIWGYGGEKVMGTVDRKIYDYFRRRRLDLSDYAWNSDYAEENNIPEDMQPFYPGQWHDCDDMGHCYGTSMDAGTVCITDENGDTVLERRLEELDGSDINLCVSDETWIDMKPAGTVVFLGTSNEKGTFFEGEIELTSPFDPELLELHTDDFDGEEILNRVIYDGVDIENWGGSTNGKSSDFAFYIAGSQQATGKWEKYSNMDDIVYTMTDWFPKKIKPVRLGLYNIKTAGKDSYTYQAKWTGEKWTNTWSEEEVKIKEWQGIAYDPDQSDPEDQIHSEIAKLSVFEPDVLKQALNELAEEYGTPTADEIEALEEVECVQCLWKGLVDETYDVEGQMVCPECREPVEFVNGGDEISMEDALEELKQEFEQLMAQEEEQQHLEQQFDTIIAKKKKKKE